MQCLRRLPPCEDGCVLRQRCAEWTGGDLVELPPRWEYNTNRSVEGSQPRTILLVRSSDAQTMHSISRTREESLSLCCFAGKILEKLTMRSLIDAQHRHILKAANYIHPKLMPKLSAAATFEHYRAIKLGSEVDLRWVRCETGGERAGVCACITRLRTRCSGPAVSIFSLLLFSCLVLLLLIRHGYLLLCILYFC
jgi:hypothetical protein